MSIEHKNLSDAERHEPKGASTAAAGDIYISDGAGSGNWKVGAGQQYADMTISTGATTFALAAASAYTRLDPGTEWTDSASATCTINAATGEITLVTAGTYLVEFWISFDTASLSAGTQYNFKYAIDGVVDPRIVSVEKETAGADSIGVAAQGIITVTANQVLSIHVAGDGTSSGTNITPTGAGLTALIMRET